MTPAQEASAIFRRKAIYEELHPETKATKDGGAFRGNQHSEVSDNLSFTSATSDATGKDKRSIERAHARGEALGDDLGAVTGTSLDKGVELDALASVQRVGEGVPARWKLAASWSQDIHSRSSKFSLI